MTQNKRQSVVVRHDLMSKSNFSRKYSVSRSTLDNMIQSGLLPGEQIDNVFYINVSKPSVIKNALENREYRPGTWHRTHNIKPYIPKSEEDWEFERAWREDMGMTE